MKPSPNVSLSNLKLYLAEKERLQDEVKSRDKSIETQESSISSELDVLKNTPDYFSDDYLQRAKIKRLKLDKHKAWKKRRNERLKAARQERKTTQMLSSTQCQPTISSIPSSTQQHASKDEKIQLQQKRNQQKQQQMVQQRIRQLTVIVEKLTHLRDLRRSKLEAKGRFFPETGNAFYDKIKSAAAAAASEHRTKNDSDDDDNIDDKQQHGHQKTIQPHVEDQWNNQPLDMDAYGYWLQGWENVEKLRRIRRQWDEYIVDEGTLSSVGLTSASKVPPTIVSPSPPSNHLWERYLE